MRFATSWSRPTLSHTSLFLILSLRVTPVILLKQDISNTCSLFSCVCFKVQVSELYINTLSTIVSYTFSFVALLMSVDDRFNIWNTVLVKPIILLMSACTPSCLPTTEVTTQANKIVRLFQLLPILCISENCYYHDPDTGFQCLTQ